MRPRRVEDGDDDDDDDVDDDDDDPAAVCDLVASKTVRALELRSSALDERAGGCRLFLPSRGFGRFLSSRGRCRRAHSGCATS